MDASRGLMFAIMAAAECREQLILYGYTVTTLITGLFAYILNLDSTKTRPNLQFPAFMHRSPRCLKLLNSRRGIGLVMALLVTSNLVAASTAAAATTGTTSSVGGDVQVGDKLPSDCQYVLNCSEQCMSCSPVEQGFNCCS